MTAKDSPTTPLRILSIDLGRTSTKACISRHPDQVILVPANVKVLSTEQVRSSNFEVTAGESLLDIWLEYHGTGYAVGQLAADFGADLGVGQSKVDDAAIKTLACAGHFGLSGDIGLVIGLPYPSQEQFDLEKEQLVGLLKTSHTIRYRGRDRLVNIAEIWVVPEGYGSLIWAQATTVSQPPLAKRSVAIVDIGHQTTDFLMVDRFRFARGASQSEPFAMSKFYDRVASQIQGADSQSLSLIEAVNHAEGDRFFRPRGSAEATDLDAIVPSLRLSFARELLDLLIAWLPERATDVLVTGGGGAFFQEDLEPLLETARLNTHFASPSRSANVLGQLLYGQARGGR